jgi:hypothetical protein
MRILNLSLQRIAISVSLAGLFSTVMCLRIYAQEGSLEQRQPLELVYADSIVPQDTHEMMLTTGAWYLRSGDLHDSFLAQKIEWGISDRLQVSAFVHLVRSSNLTGATANGFGDMEIGARYTWATVGSQFTHIALAFDAGFPTGDPRKGLGEGKYTVLPSLLLSHEFRKGKYQIFSTSGAELIAGHRQLSRAFDAQPYHSIFVNSGLSRRIGHGWAIGELSVNSNYWSGGNETQVILTPSYVWRIARRTELLLGVPIGLTSSAEDIGGVLKFTFELGGPGE